MLSVCSASGAVLPATCYAKAMESHPTEGDPTKKMEDAKSFLLRLRGTSLQQACTDCARELDEAADFEAKFLVLDTWIRFFDGEPLPGGSLQTVKDDPLKESESHMPTEGREGKEAKEGTAGKEGKERNEGRERKEGKERKEGRERKERKEGQEPKEGKEPKEPKEPKEGKDKKGKTDNKQEAAEGDQSGNEASEGPKETPKEVPRFAKYKRLKEALALFAERFGKDPFASVVPAWLKAAGELADESSPAAQLPAPPQPKVARPCRIRREPVSEVADDKVSPKAGETSEAVDLPADKVVKLSASSVYCLLANAALLNVRGFVDLQKLYLSSAKAAPQKILCLLAYFYCGSKVTAACDREVVFERAISSEESVRRYLPDPTSQVGSPQMLSEVQADGWADEESGEEGEGLPAVTFTSDFATSLDGSQGAIILLSSAGSFGVVADVKTPPEEVPLWEMPELLCSKLVLGSLPLADGEVAVVRSVRRWNCCMTEGPLLHLAEDRPPETLLDIAAMDIQRHIDDRRFAIESLRRDSAKWSSCFRHLAKDIVAVSHPPLIGMGPTGPANSHRSSWRQQHEQM
eukprot:s2195_g23.t1